MPVFVVRHVKLFHSILSPISQWGCSNKFHFYYLPVFPILTGGRSVLSLHPFPTLNGRESGRFQKYRLRTVNYSYPVYRDA